VHTNQEIASVFVMKTDKSEEIKPPLDEEENAYWDDPKARKPKGKKIRKLRHYEGK
jgi:hypothetical protein